MRKAVIFVLIIFVTGCQPKNQNSDEEKRFSFVFMTDIHVQPELHGAEGFRKAVEKVNELDPDFVITGGDLVGDALGASESRADSLFDLYTEISANFKMPVYNTMGNHENFGVYPESGIDTTHEEYGKKMFENKIGKRYYSFNYKGWHFIVLDAVGITPERGYIGKISNDQIEWIKSDLGKIDRETPVVVTVHIPFITARTQLVRGSLAANNEGTVITNAREVLLLFYPYNLKLVLQGHLHHLEDIYVANKVHFLTGGAVCGQWWKGPVNDYVEEGFVRINVDGNNLSWEYIDYGWDPVSEKLSAKIN